MSDVERQKPTDECLSGWTLSQIATGLLPDADRRRGDAHLAVCARCAALLQEERNEVEAARYERVPEALLAHARANKPKRVAWLWASTAAVFAASAAVLLMVLPAQDHDSSVRLKGEGAVEASVLRGSEVVVDQVPLDRIGQLEDGDRLRLRVPKAFGRWSMVDVWQEEAWVPAFHGPVPDDGWLPLGLAVATGGRTRLRVLGCATPPPQPLGPSQGIPETCVLQVFELEVRAR